MSYSSSPKLAHSDRSITLRRIDGGALVYDSSSSESLTIWFGGNVDRETFGHQCAALFRVKQQSAAMFSAVASRMGFAYDPQVCAEKTLLLIRRGRANKQVNLSF